MVASATTHPTLLDRETLTNPDGSMVQVVEMLQQFNEVLADMPFYDANMGTSHRTTVRVGQPEPTWRKMYGGVQPSKSEYANIIDTTGMLADYAEIDKAAADLNGNSAAWRLREEVGFVEGFAQKLATTIFYGNEATESEAFTGLSPRYNDLSAENADNIIDAGGTGSDNRSIWLVCWDQTTAHGITPQGMSSGLTIKDLGEVTAENIDGSNGMAQVYRSYYEQHAGLVLRDWRYVVRICNIDKSLLVKDASTGADLPDLFFQAVERLHSRSRGRCAAYMSRDVRTKFRQQLAYQTKDSTLEWKNVGGIPAMMLDEVPFRRVDALAVDEARVT